MADRILPPLTDKMKARFWAKIIVGEADECWLWTAASLKRGYGVMTIWHEKRAGVYLATHIALALVGKVRPPRGLALHSCDNPACCNPSHLRWGTHLDNERDKIARGRARSSAERTATLLIYGARGEGHASAKLTEQKVRAIRSDTRSCAAIARAYGVAVKTINDVKLGKTWKHV